MKRFIFSAILGFILALSISFLTYFVIGNASEMQTPFITWILISLAIYFLPFLLGGLILEMAKKNNLWLILAFLFFLIPLIITLLLFFVGVAFNNIT